jgi:hypothetical protein
MLQRRVAERLSQPFLVAVGGKLLLWFLGKKKGDPLGSPFLG